MTTACEVRLRRPNLADVALLDLWRSDPVYAGEFNDFGLPPSASYRQSVENGSIIDDTGGLMVVEVSGKPVGTVSWRAVAYGPNPESRCWNIGISLVPEARGHGWGSIAQRQLGDLLFATTPVHRVEASTDVMNYGEQRALEKAGFTREGVVRGGQFRAGSWRDIMLYSRLRTDP
jgi:RimJ/RimL family protein N-acetyltransferase